ncbi:MAG: hypothetical protein K1X53_12715 [Candidatus Sumerlaeaceae bacterium]|nr:hypothetical protein [Candidatus Sumerlaeaceae bacterium]
MRRYVIGVDGGGTKTLGAIALATDGVVLAQNEVGSTNHHSNPIEFVRGNLEALFNNLLHAVGGKPEDVDMVCLGMAGVDRPEDKPLIRGLVSQFLPSARCEPVNDAIIALMGGALKPLGVIVIAGTGSIAFGVNGAGERARAGGWGNVLGDEGSGYAIGLRGLRAAMRSADGRIAPTALKDIILKHFNFDRVEQILGWVKENQGSKAEIAALSRLVFEAHAAGDALATEILQGEAAELVMAVKAIAGKLFPGNNDFPIVVAGGNLRKSKAYFEMFEAGIGKELPGARVLQPQREPVEGAVLYAIELMKQPA